MPNFAGLVWKADFGHSFGNILGLGAYQKKRLYADHEFEPVDLNTMNPIIRTIYFSLIIEGSEPFFQPFSHRKISIFAFFNSP